MFTTPMNGGTKVRRPNLGHYDSRRPPSAAADPAYNQQFDSWLYADAPRTWARDKALLVALGVDGDVPLAQARVNAGLDPDPSNMTLAQFADAAAKSPKTDLAVLPVGPDGGYQVPDELVSALLAEISAANDNHKIAAVAA